MCVCIRERDFATKKAKEYTAMCVCVCMCACVCIRERDKCASDKKEKTISKKKSCDAISIAAETFPFHSTTSTWFHQ